ncbi:solute carrier family 22 member 7 [Ooceraea biroi]|nr:solute carrier family 22 member 7 [Ooceraea biroi]
MNTSEVKVGCFQKFLVLLLGVNYVIVAMSHALPVFHNYTPKFYCQMRNSTNKSYGCQSIVNSSISTNVTAASSGVLIFTSCAGEYRFVTEFAESSVVTEWSLVCERRYLSSLGSTVYYTGVLLGALITGFLADRFGRLPVQAICLYAQGMMAVALYIVQSYSAFLVLRGLQGAFVQGLQNSTYILSLELFPMRSRTVIALIMQISWSIGLVLLAVLSYIIPNWRILQLAISVPTAITVLYIWIIPESPRWLLARGKSTEADITIERIIKYNDCCTTCTTLRATIPVQETCVKNTAALTNLERKSDVISVDLKKASTDEDQREAANLLNDSKLVEEEIIKKSVKTSANMENRLSEVELYQDSSSSEQNFDKKYSSSSLKYVRKSKVMLHEQRLSLKVAEEAMLCKPAKEKPSENEEEYVENYDKKHARSNIGSMLKETFKSLTLKKYGVAILCQWLTSAMACCIFTDLSPSVPINRHVMFALSGALEVATYIFMFFILCRYGRRMPMCVYQFLNGIVCILIAVFLILSSTTSPWHDLVKIVIFLFGRITVTSTISIAYLYTVEIFPTVVRSTYLGLCIVFAKTGSLGISHLLLSGHMALPVPLLAVGVLCFVSSILVLILPETLNRILPDQMTDIEKIDDNRNSVNQSEINTKKKESSEWQILREKLFSEDWVDAGNGILVNFMENKNVE